jgi:hypothetical protein
MDGWEPSKKMDIFVDSRSAQGIIYSQQVVQ